MNKADSNQVATKKDIQNLRAEIKAQRSDSKRTEKSLRAEILRVEASVENVEESQKRMEPTLNKISIQLDGFVGRVDDLTAENEVGAHHTRELQKRVAKLESSRQAA